MNRQEALADRDNAGKTAEQAVSERIAKIMAVPHVLPGRTLGDELAATLKGTAAAGVVPRWQGLAGRERRHGGCIEMEARDTTSSAKIAELHPRAARAG